MREAIRLNPDQVKLHIARSGIPIKQLLQGMAVKTVHRIKAGQNTTWGTAHKLAQELGTTVENLLSPLTAESLFAFLPEKWIYEDAPSSDGIPNRVPFWACIEGALEGYFIGRPPVDDFKNPIDQLIEWHGSVNKKILLRQEDQSFVFEIQYFDYSREQEIVYQASSACRFFPLMRNGNFFSKAILGDMLHRYAWTRLRQVALANAEIVEIEGDEYPRHPSAYFPLVRFYKGSIVKRCAIGARFFRELNADFRSSLITFLQSLDAGRVRANTTKSGLSIIVKPSRPAEYKLGWQEEEVEIEVDLVWRTPDGSVALAPWRQTYRQQFVDGINSRKWPECYSPGMPERSVIQNDAHDIDTPLEPDRSLSAESISAIDAIDNRNP